MNNVKLQGVLVSHHTTKNGTMLLTMNVTGYVSATRPISDEERAKMDYASVTVTKPELTTKLQEILQTKKHPHITVEGRLQRAIPKGNRMATITTRAINLALTESTMKEKFGLETAASTKKYTNEVAVSGRLDGISTHPEKDIIDLTIFTKDEHGEATVTCTVFGQKKYIIQHFKIGDNIAGIGAIRTRRKMDNRGTMLYFENCVLTEVLFSDEKEQVDALTQGPSVPSTVTLP